MPPFDGLMADCCAANWSRYSIAFEAAVVEVKISCFTAAPQHSEPDDIEAEFQGMDSTSIAVVICCVVSDFLSWPVIPPLIVVG